MANLLRDYYYFARKIVWLRIDGLRLKWAIYMAHTKQKAYNKRFFVLPNEKHQLQVYCNSDIKRLKRGVNVRFRKNGKTHTKKIHLMNPNATHLDVMRECFYYTPLHLNDKHHAITEEEKNEKKKNWLQYAFNIRTLKRNKK